MIYFIFTIFLKNEIPFALHLFYSFFFSFFILHFDLFFSLDMTLYHHSRVHSIPSTMVDWTEFTWIVCYFFISKKYYKYTWTKKLIWIHDSFPNLNQFRLFTYRTQSKILKNSIVLYFTVEKFLKVHTITRVLTSQWVSKCEW